MPKGKGKTRMYKITLSRKGAKDPLIGSIRAKNKTAAKKNFTKNLRFKSMTSL